MADVSDRDLLVSEFTKYWNKEVRKGKVSAFDSQEVFAIFIYTRWLLDNYDLIKKENKT